MIGRALRSLRNQLHGHAYTLGPRLFYGRKLVAPPAEVWRTRCTDAHREFELTGLLTEVPNADTLVIILHGCGGAPTSHYAVMATTHFVDKGVSVLRLAWRGADFAGEDIYHAAQSADVHAAIADARFRNYRRIWMVGYSLGGHCCLHVAHETKDPRVAAVATVCPVLHLVQTNLAIDHPSRAMYRRYVLRGLISNYEHVAKRGLAHSPYERVRAATTFRAYDAVAIVPRYGFASVDDYYTRACASQVLGAIALPTLIVAARHDPMLPWQIAEHVRPSLSPSIEFVWAERGGHAGFPADLNLGLDDHGALGLEAQVHAWLEKVSA